MSWVGKALAAPFRLIWWLVKESLRLIGRVFGIRNPSGEMDGAAYEAYVAHYLTREGYRKVTQTGQSGDMGVDIVAKKHGISYAVQCKYYSAPVSGTAVQEAVAGMAMYDCQRAMVVTNSRLTEGARRLAEANNVIVLEGVSPERRAAADILTPTRIISIAAGAVLFVLLLPDIQRRSATGWGIYAAAAVGCYLAPRLFLAMLHLLWRQLRRRKETDSR